MRVQSAHAIAAGPLGGLPTPVPLQQEVTPFAAELRRIGQTGAAERATVHGPLALPPAIPDTPAGPSAVPRVDAARAYARAPGGQAPPAVLSLRV